MAEKELDSSQNHPKCAICRREKSTSSNSHTQSNHSEETPLKIQDLCSWCALHHFNGSFMKNWRYRMTFVLCNLILIVTVWIKVPFVMIEKLRVYLSDNNVGDLILIIFNFIFILISFIALSYLISKIWVIVIMRFKERKTYLKLGPSLQFKCPHCQAELTNVITEINGSLVEINSIKDIQLWNFELSVNVHEIHHNCPSCKKEIERLQALSKKETKLFGSVYVSSVIAIVFPMTISFALS